MKCKTEGCWPNAFWLVAELLQMVADLQLLTTYINENKHMGSNPTKSKPLMQSKQFVYEEITFAASLVGTSHSQ